MSVDLIYIDESGYARNWESSVKSQPFYVLAAITFPVSDYLRLEKIFIERLTSIEVPGSKFSEFGYGEELKARRVASGDGFWGKNEPQRNQVRDLYLSFPAQNGQTCFVVVIDKKAHAEKYAWPENPYYLALKFLLERIRAYLQDSGRHGICVYDLNHGEEGQIGRNVSKLFKSGSAVQYWSQYYNDVIEKTNDFDPIVEF